MQVFMRTAFSAAAIAALSISFAQAQQTLAPVVVSANPLGADINDLITPVSVLRGDQLTQNQSSTLGQTLNQLPGVSSSDFGPNSSRPVIRGLDGDRIRIMNNGGASMDVSGLSYDHAVGIEPLLVEQIEVVRGPAALQYGGSAIGGAVNVIDNRIPKAPVKGVNGRGELRAGGAESERAAAGVVTVGDGRFALHVDGADRKTDDLKVPKQAGRRDEDGPGSLNQGRLLNSNSDQQSGAIGASLTGDHGYLGISLDSYKNDYGTGLFEVEDDETDLTKPKRIRLKQERLTLAGEQRNLAGKMGPLESIRGSFSSTDYKHEELAGGEVEATYKNKGWDSRIEGTHLPIQTSLGALKGAWGIQGSESKFSATGSEHHGTFVPNAKTDSKALFVFEELSFAPGKAVNAGFRYEDVKVQSLGGVKHIDNGVSETFDVDSKKFKPFSLALGYRQDMGAGWTGTAGLSYTERAPTFYELYADGEHHATGTYERGNSSNKKEKGTTLELGMKFKTPTTRANFSAYVTEFSNFIGLVQGGYVNHHGEYPRLDKEDCEAAVNPRQHCSPLYNFTGIKARLYGLEADGRFPLASGLFGKASQLNLDWKADYARGENRTTGGALPRIAPFRLSSALVYSEGKYSSQVDVQHAARQNRYADDLGATPSYTMFGLGASYKTAVSGMKSAYLFLRVHNLTNVEARNASSVLRDMAPAGARAIRVGFRGNF
jgi:iron complex outermembrane recepter protein